MLKLQDTELSLAFQGARGCEATGCSQRGRYPGVPHTALKQDAMHRGEGCPERPCPALRPPSTRTVLFLDGAVFGMKCALELKDLDQNKNANPPLHNL